MMSKFDADEYLKDVLHDAKEFAKLVAKLDEELQKHLQFSMTQRLAYDGLDIQINNTLVSLQESFEALEAEINSNRPVDIEYHLARIQTLSNEGTDLIGKAIDIAQNKKLEGASVLHDIKSAFTNFGQWVGKKLGLYNKNSTELQNAMKKSRGFMTSTMQTSFKDTKNKVGTHFGQKVSKQQEDLVRRPKPE